MQDKDKQRLESAGGRRRPVVVGLLGGVASGKSTVAALFADRGWAVADADRLCHEALDEPGIRDRVVARFGRDVLGPDGRIDRARLARVFAQAADLADLESILHPVVQARTLALIESARDAGAPGVVVDAPLLLESDLGALCDALVMIEVSETTRTRRARDRGMEPDDWARRERRQLSVDEKRRRADHSIDGEAPLAEVRRAVEGLERLFLGRGPGKKVGKSRPEG
jgi:dephospho-CoA kinase